jgi:hypothetical protein
MCLSAPDKNPLIGRLFYQVWIPLTTKCMHSNEIVGGVHPPGMAGHLLNLWWTTRPSSPALD